MTRVERHLYRMMRGMVAQVGGFRCGNVGGVARPECHCECCDAAKSDATLGALEDEHERAEYERLKEKYE